MIPKRCPYCVAELTEVEAEKYTELPNWKSVSSGQFNSSTEIVVACESACGRIFAFNQRTEGLTPIGGQGLLHQLELVPAEQ